MASIDEPLQNIPRGNTCAGVNREIVKYLFENYSLDSEAAILDIPSGKGDFLNAIKAIFPAWKTKGADIQSPGGEFGYEFIQLDASQSDALTDHGEFDIVTCISGVMEFDNTLAFFEKVRGVLTKDGLLIATNDNILTVRDRLLYLFFGRFAQYPFSTSSNAPTWKILPVQNLIRIVSDAGFEVKELKYVPVRPTDWLWAPLAAFLFVVEKIYQTIALRDRFRDRTFKFSSLLSRHYVLICHPKN